MTIKQKPQVLAANIQDKTRVFLELLFVDLKCYELKYASNINQFFESPEEGLNPILLIVDGQSSVEQAAEWVQMLKMTYPVPLIVIHGPENSIDFSLFRKNGADHLIHFHYDREFIVDLILSLAPADFEDEIPLAALNPIDYNEIHPEMEINFDVFVHLPGNRKTILLRRTGSLIEEKTLKKVKESKQNLYFKKTETKKFLEYARTAVTMHDSVQNVAMTEKLIKSKKIIFDIMAEFFNTETNNFEVGKTILDRCKKILSEYDILVARTPREAFDRIALLSGQVRSFYQDAIYTANFSALIGQIISLDATEIETLALAGLLHNIGLANVPEFQSGDDWTQLSGEARIRYLGYPEKSVNMVKSQRVPLPPEVSTAILQHRENPDGSGFPNRLKSYQICQNAKILAIANRIHEMTGLVKNQSRYTFKITMDTLKNEIKEGQSPHDMVLLMQILKTAGA